MKVKKRNDLPVVIVFTISWIFKPISYNEIRRHQPSHSQNTRSIILAKDINSDFFLNGLAPQLPQRQKFQTIAQILNLVLVDSA